MEGSRLERNLTFSGAEFVHAGLPENAWLEAGHDYRLEIEAAEPFFVELVYAPRDGGVPAWRVAPPPRRLQELFGQNSRPLNEDNALSLEVVVRAKTPHL